MNITYNTADIDTYISKMKEVTPMTPTMTATLTTNANGSLDGFTVNAYTWQGREVNVCHEKFRTPVAAGDQPHLMWEVSGLGWQLLARDGMTLTLAAPADARTVFPEDAFF